ncbi:class I SAM-dependent methyltransferase [Streptomyces sp. DT224]|uniref:class I SAM-dependent methyltransferase n=1 Tax=Streptomyces sp. DT224 TaxID=3393426 RepID=UPI003CEDE00D
MPGPTLDIGSGPGVHAMELARRGHQAVLSDLSANSLDSARARFRRAGLEGHLLGTGHSPAQHLTPPPGQFDAVLMLGVDTARFAARGVDRGRSAMTGTR